MDIRVIKNTEEHAIALAEAQRLVMRDPAPGTPDGDRLELLALLIEDFEKRSFPFETPDPIEAIEFRMEELGLKQRDLVPFLGSKSRVSEVLSRKRPLTIQMIRSLSEGLDIPVELLISRPQEEQPKEESGLDWGKFPFKEMKKRGWFDELAISKGSDTAEAVLQAFFSQLAGARAASALYRRTLKGEKLSDKAFYSALAWTARVLVRASHIDKALVGRFSPSKLSIDVLKDLARLSWFGNGPKLAMEFLEKLGILVIIEPRLTSALIDGAAMLSDRGVPVIGMTLRIDRIDYFWFTLLHEVVHIWKHIQDRNEAYVDRVENMGLSVNTDKEANRIARDVFVPRALWTRSPAFLNPSKQNIQQLADECHIHPAIVVGRLQYETGRYESFRELLGQDSVRRLFHGSKV
jgi:HTH-type transcriptional regulator / antitoxin HigA